LPLKLTCIIKLCVSIGKPDTIQTLQQATEKPKVYKWYNLFSDGRTSTEDDKRADRPTIIRDTIVKSVDSLVNEDRRVTIHDISDRLGVGRSTSNIILKEKLDVNKLCAGFYRMMTR